MENVYIDRAFQDAGLGRDGFVGANTVAAILRNKPRSIYLRVSATYAGMSGHFFGCTVFELEAALNQMGVTVQWFDGQADD